MIEHENAQSLNTVCKISSEYFKRLRGEYQHTLTPNQSAVLQEVLCCIETSRSADILYQSMSDNDENSIAFFAENTESPVIQAFFQAILSVLACLTYTAYRSEGRNDLPEDIESINETELDDFFAFIRNTMPSAEVCFAYFCRNVCL